MRLRVKAGIAAVLVVAGAVGLVWLLGEGLDRAEKWISIVVGCVSMVSSIGGLVLGWLTWQQTRAAGSTAPAVTAAGTGGVGVGGGNSGGIRTDVSGATPPAPLPSAGGTGVHASGTGSVAVGGDNTGQISTRFTGP